jgi:D-inositol-3-phosphate glycosyltransferase
MSGIAAELVAREFSLPSVLRFHGFGDDGIRHRMELKLARAVTQVSAGCTAEAFELIRMGRPRSGTSVIPYGVDIEVFTPDGPKARRGEERRLVGVGKLLPCNGFDAVIRALPFIPDAEFVVIREPDSGNLKSDREARRLRRLARELGVADRLRLHGGAVATELPALLRSADVVACTPVRESFGTVALEAMACGVPLVACAVGALPDVVVHDVTGYLVGGQDPRELAAVANALLQDSFLRRSLRAAGRDRTVARYTWDRIAADTVRLYEKSIQAGLGEPKAASG